MKIGLKENILHIKNMVCDRCLMSVENTLREQNLNYITINLGRVELENQLSPSQFQDLKDALATNGFEIVSKRTNKIITEIKSLVIKMVYNHKDFQNKKLSEVLSEELNYDYSHLTSLFSKEEGQSIQSFQNKIKVERIKELLEYDELNISEIAYKMDFGSAAYLSTFFKKETGLNPSQYKTKLFHRKPLDDI
ncbi:response regulator transcription factor [Salegentibacter sp. BLCTC]|uniref:response regulator transcription factor n=1 Tax=Salegentibacter sp. BLCTC TaxID=2697368 RepID=UPI001D11F9D3|nr:response regulator transcription factor [Salegentibacter sp. BLCTC]